MAKEVMNSQLRKEFARWLEYKRINPNDVLMDFSVKHEDGQVVITFSMLAPDFPVPSEHGPNCTFKNKEDEEDDSPRNLGPRW